jgi:Peptidase family M23
MPGRARGAYGWPIKPFGRQHPVRGFLNDPREGRKLSFHFGIDISAPDGTPVHAVVPGRVFLESARAVAVVGPTQTFGYWHVVPAVANGDFVEKGQVLGHIAPRWGHVHFAERRADRYRNPLRRGGIHPYTDRWKPTIASIGFFRRGQAVSPERVSGTVELIVEAFDTPPRPVPAPWAGLPVTPA